MSIINTGKVITETLKRYLRGKPEEPMAKAVNGENLFVAVTDWMLCRVGKQNPFRDDIFKSDLTKHYQHWLGNMSEEYEAELTNEQRVEPNRMQYRKLVRKWGKKEEVWVNVDLFKFLAKGAEPKWYITDNEKQTFVLAADHYGKVELLALGWHLKGNT